MISVPVSDLCYCPDDTIGGRRVWIPPPNLGTLTSYALRNGAKIVPRELVGGELKEGLYVLACFCLP